MRRIINNFNTIIKLPISCKKILSKEIAENNMFNLRTLFDLTKPNGKLRMKYSLSSYNNYSKCKLPKEVWKTKSGHCFELSLFLLACLKYLKFDAYYYEMPNFKQGNHACVEVKLNNKSIFIDLGRRKFNAKYMGYNRLNEKQTIGNYYINCASMFYPDKWHTKKISKKKRVKLCKKTYKFAKIGLKCYQDSKRAKDLIKFAKNKLEKLC